MMRLLTRYDVPCDPTPRGERCRYDCDGEDHGCGGDERHSRKRRPFLPSGCVEAVPARRQLGPWRQGHRRLRRLGAGASSHYLVVFVCSCVGLHVFCHMYACVYACFRLDLTQPNPTRCDHSISPLSRSMLSMTPPPEPRPTTISLSRRVPGRVNAARART